jgi:hypothetical protein
METRLAHRLTGGRPGIRLSAVPQGHPEILLKRHGIAHDPVMQRFPKETLE